jgi:DNA polymerase type B, organellar and viral.
MRKLSIAFGQTASKGWYIHSFNRQENLHYAGSIPNTPYYGIDKMSAEERTEFLEWYDSQRSELFDNRRVLDIYCHDDVTLLRQACHVLRREFLQVCIIVVFHESVTIAFACNKDLRKLF